MHKKDAVIYFALIISIQIKKNFQDIIVEYYDSDMIFKLPVIPSTLLDL